MRFLTHLRSLQSGQYLGAFGVRPSSTRGKGEDWKREPLKTIGGKQKKDEEREQEELILMEGDNDDFEQDLTLLDAKQRTIYEEDLAFFRTKTRWKRANENKKNNKEFQKHIWEEPEIIFDTRKPKMDEEIGFQLPVMQEWPSPPPAERKITRKEQMPIAETILNEMPKVQESSVNTERKRGDTGHMEALSELESLSLELQKAVKKKDAEQNENHISSEDEEPILIKTKRKAAKKEPIKPIGEFVYGSHAVLSALKYNKRSNYNKLYYVESVHRHFSTDPPADYIERVKKTERIIELAEKRGVEVEACSRVFLNKLIVGAPHNGFVLDCDPLESKDITEYPLPVLKPGEVALVLDSINDTHNIGAILRTSMFFGVKYVIITEKNTPYLSPGVAKTSRGSLDCSEIRSCDGVASTLEDLKASNENLRVIGLTVKTGEEGNTVVPLPALKVGFGESVVVVVGNEGLGSDEEVLASCTDLVHIEGDVRQDALDSLNVGISLAITLFHISTLLNTEIV